MAKPGNTIHIPLKPEEAIKNLLKVKPAADMPRFSAKAGAKGKAKRKQGNTPKK